MISILLIVACQACKDDGTTPEVPQRITLTLIDAAVQEAYLHIAVNSPANNETLSLQRDGSTVLTFAVVADTNIADTALTQTSTYQYTATLQTANATTGKGNTLAVQTLAPTSHDWHFTIDSLGVASSTLYDVAIISDSSAWVVGELYLRDSSGNVDPVLYNAAHWNGTTWKCKRIRVLYRGSWILPQLNAIFAFSATDIWLSSGVPIHGDGQNWTQYHLFDMGILSQSDGSINKIWGNNSSDLWFVGNRGTIAHYTSGTWQRVESGTTVNLLDVWGSPDGSVVWACGWEDFQPTVLLRGIGSTWEKRYEDPYPFVLRRDSLSGIISSVWTPVTNRIFAATGYGIYDSPANTRGAARLSTFAALYLPGFPFRIRGAATNDFFVVGENSMVAHFNGLTWQYYGQLYDENIRLRSVAHKGRSLFCTGHTLDPFYRRAVVVRGTR
ncbi:MAG: hypothetical protein HY961_11985 [Ignavibacteriae bacterium]|nr:hypothetical protein [Ignavibacteriota bacterium]